jgi:hypothetical protein
MPESFNPIDKFLLINGFYVIFQIPEEKMTYSKIWGLNISIQHLIQTQA